MTMRDQILHIIELAKAMERAECCAEWFDSGINDSLRQVAKAEDELDKSVAEFLRKHDQQYS